MEKHGGFNLTTKLLGAALLILFCLPGLSMGQSLEEAARLSQQVGQLYRQGRYQEAIFPVKRALAIYEKALGPDHPRVATSLNNLALLYSNLGDYAGAEPLYKRSLAIYEKALGPDHPDVALGLNNLAFLYVADGRIGEALNIFKKTNTPGGLGACYLARNNHSKAEREFQKSLKYSQKTGRKIFIISSRIGLGLSYEGMGDLEMAKGHFKEAVDLIEAQWQALGLAARKTFLAGEVGIGFSRLDAYEGMVRVIIKGKKRGYQREALQVAERMKSRTLLEMLAAKGASG
ncbi:MAG: tetratricopeptide repeat protein, partial [Desulfatiglandales bacterium]|nr:tetratricopeptide repeat protein [Desulfatiglandales bacterium]